jgi:hypothetical protein
MRSAPRKLLENPLVYRNVAARLYQYQWFARWGFIGRLPTESRFASR